MEEGRVYTYGEEHSEPNFSSSILGDHEMMPKIEKKSRYTLKEYYLDIWTIRRNS